MFFFSALVILFIIFCSVLVVLGRANKIPRLGGKLPKGNWVTISSGIGLGLSLAYLGGVLLARQTIPFNMGLAIFFAIIFFVSSTLLGEKVKKMKLLLRIGSIFYGGILAVAVLLNFFHPGGGPAIEQALKTPGPVVTLTAPTIPDGGVRNKQPSANTPAPEVWTAAQEPVIDNTGPDIIELDKKTQVIVVPSGYQLCFNLADGGTYQQKVSWVGGESISRRAICTDVPPGENTFIVGARENPAEALRYESYLKKGISYPFLKKK